MSVNGIGMVLAGITSTLPPMSYSSFSLSLINLTGVAARRVGIGVAIVLVALAFFSKLAALLLTIPGPVLGAYLMLAMGVLFVSGWQTILRDGLDSRRALVVALPARWAWVSTITPSCETSLVMSWAGCSATESPSALWLRSA